MTPGIHRRAFCWPIFSLVAAAVCFGCSPSVELVVQNKTKDPAAFSFQDWSVGRGWNVDVYPPMPVPAGGTATTTVRLTFCAYALARIDGALAAWRYSCLRGSVGRLRLTLLDGKGGKRIETDHTFRWDWPGAFLTVVFGTVLSASVGFFVVKIVSGALRFLPERKRLKTVKPDFWTNRRLAYAACGMFLALWTVVTVSFKPSPSTESDFSIYQPVAVRTRIALYFETLRELEAKKNAVSDRAGSAEK